MERTEEGGEAQSVADGAGPEPRVRRRHAETRRGKGVDFLESPRKGVQPFKKRGGGIIALQRRVPFHHTTK